MFVYVKKNNVIHVSTISHIFALNFDGHVQTCTVS